MTRAPHRPLLTVVAISAVPLIATLAGCAGTPKRPTSAALAPAPVVVPGTARPPLGAPRRHAPERRRHVTRARALATARTFLRAFAAYERGADTPDVRSALARTGAPALSRSLLAGPPRRPPGARWPTPARVRRLALHGPSDGRVKVLAMLARGARRTTLELLLHRDPRTGAWRVTELG